MSDSIQFLRPDGTEAHMPIALWLTQNTARWRRGMTCKQFMAEFPTWAVLRLQAATGASEGSDLALDFHTALLVLLAIQEGDANGTVRVSVDALAQASEGFGLLAITEVSRRAGVLDYDGGDRLLGDDAVRFRIAERFAPSAALPPDKSEVAIWSAIEALSAANPCPVPR